MSRRHSRVVARCALWACVAVASLAVPSGALEMAEDDALPSERPLRAAFLIVDGVYNSELMAPHDIFHHTVFHVRPYGIEVAAGVGRGMVLDWPPPN